MITAQQQNTARPNMDFVLLGVALVLTTLGILLIFDASYGYALQNGLSVFKFVKQQSIYAVLGIALMLYLARTPYTALKKYALGLMGVSLFALILVFAPHIGVMKNGAHRWIGHGSFVFQPSELTKFAVVVYVATVCAGRPKLMKDFWNGPFPPLFLICLAGIFIVKEPDLGTALVVVLTGLAALFFSGMKKRHLAACLAVGALLLCVVVFGHRHGSGSYPTGRVATFLHPERDAQGKSYQVDQGLIALGSGGPFGMGIGTGREKYYLPESYTDFIFAILGEETGLVGTLIVLVLYGVLVGRGMHIASRASDPLGSVLAATVSAAFGIQALLNLGVVTSSIPATGVPLPFLSYGGTSLLLSLAFVGILLSVNRFAPTYEDASAAARKPATERDFDRRWDRGATLSRPEYKRDIPVAPRRTRTKPMPTR